MCYRWRVALARRFVLSGLLAAPAVLPAGGLLWGLPPFRPDGWLMRYLGDDGAELGREFLRESPLWRGAPTPWLIRARMPAYSPATGFSIVGRFVAAARVTRIVGTSEHTDLRVVRRWGAAHHLFVSATAVPIEPPLS